MTDDEFSQFFDHLDQAAGIREWFGRMKLPPNADRAEEAQKLKRRWGAWLARYELSDATDAIDAIMAGEETHPRWPRDWPYAIGAIIRRHRSAGGTSNIREEGPRLINGEEVVSCLQCSDWGRFSVWSREAMELARAGKLKPPYPALTAVVACTCEASRIYRRTHRTFCPDRDLPLFRQDEDGEWRTHWTWDTEEQARLKTFVDALHKASPAETQQQIPF